MTARLIIANADPSDMSDTGNRRFARHYDELEEEIELQDYIKGFDAGYFAQSEMRAVLSTPAYREGFDAGACAIARRRQVMATARAAAPRPWRPWRVILMGFVVGLLLGWAVVKSVRADTLADWNQLNEMCQGGSGAQSDKACAARNPTAAKLRAAGWYQGNHGVWVSPEHVAAFTQVVRRYDATARANPGMLDSVITGMMTDLRRAVPDEAIFALWNGRAGQLLATTPYAAALLMYALPYLERTLSGKNDPRFVMVRVP